MSTEHQRYSVESQSRAIREYAALHNYEVVRTYADHGKSGLSLERREALRQLIDDVESRRADFRSVLVYDVSRWGRFQDADESAYYEYRCRRAGIAVLYCAEQFENDGSPMAAVLKGLKRAMAAEYSRELSRKAFAGQMINVEHGFKSGGVAPFGMQRQIVHQNGEMGPKLKQGQRKGFLTDRIILGPGTPEDVRTLRWMFKTFVYGDMNEIAIADALNRKGVPTIFGNGWTFASVQRTLKNELYTGTYVWNRTQQKLRSRRTSNPPEHWFRRENVFEPVIEPTLFEATKGVFRAREEAYSTPSVLESLRALARSHRHVTAKLINDTHGMPQASLYNRRFGSLAAALTLAGVTPYRSSTSVDFTRSLRRMREQVLKEIMAGVQRRGAQVRRRAHTLVVNEEILLTVEIMRCVVTPAMGWRTWMRAVRIDESADVRVTVRMNEANDAIKDYCIAPSAEGRARPIRISAFEDASMELHRFDTLEPLFSLCARVAL